MALADREALWFAILSDAMMNQDGLVISVVIPVYRDGRRALATVEAMLAQVLPDGMRCEIIVVDDGSDDDTAMLLSTCLDPRVSTLRLPINQGRSAARNAGATHARGKFIAFIDCDCRPINMQFLASHITMLCNDHIATCGPVTGDGHGFWSRYQNEASARRARQHTQGYDFSGSSQNFMVQGDAFRQSGGFDARYTEYGFEDRDLFVRLSRLGALGWCANAAVMHLDTLTLPIVLRKMHKAAGNSAAIFSHDHVKAYKKLGYAFLDTRLHSWLKPAGWMAPDGWHTLSRLDRLITSRWTPYVPAKWFVKLLVALAYIRGSNPSQATSSPGCRDQHRSSR